MRRAMLTWVLVFAFTYTTSAQQERQLTETQWDQYSQQRLTVLLLTPEAVPEPEVFPQPPSLFQWRVHQGLMPLRESAFLQMVGLEEMSHRVYRRQKKAKRLRRIGHFLTFTSTLVLLGGMNGEDSFGEISTYAVLGLSVTGLGLDVAGRRLARRSQELTYDEAQEVARQYNDALLQEMVDR